MYSAFPAGGRGILNSRQVVNAVVRLVKVEERWEASDHQPQAPCHDEFRGLKSDAVEIRWRKKQHHEGREPLEPLPCAEIGKVRRDVLERYKMNDL
ncbi:hypothetical protein TNCV_295261 [Trichonephila clavipes]|nr:hypothetical protein TNCV_295261 [Trichonephila clavipes]